MAKNKLDKSLQEALDTMLKLKTGFSDIDKTILSAAKNAKSLADMPLDKGTPKEVNDRLQKSATYRKQVNEQLKEQQRLEKALASAQAKFYSAQSSVNKDLQQVRQETNLLNKEKREEAQLNSKLVGAYRKTSIALNKMRGEYKDLAIQKENGIRLSKKEEKRMEALRGDIMRVDSALKKVDGSTGQYQRNVGNYASALGGLKNVFTSMVGAFGVVEGLRIGFNYAKEAIAVAKAAKGVEFAFDRLGEAGVSAFQNIKKSTRGLISDLDIKTALNEFQNFNINLEQTDTLFEFLAVRAAQTGKNVDKLKESLVEGLAKESKLRIDNLGISTADLNAELAKTPDFAQAVANIAKREIAEAGNILDEAANSSERLSVGFANAQLALGKLLTSGNIPILGSVADIFENIADTLDFLRISFNNAKKGIDNFLIPIKQIIKEFPIIENVVRKVTDIIGGFFKIFALSPLKTFGLALMGTAAIFSGFGNVIRESKKDIVEFIELIGKSAALLFNPVKAVKELGVDGIKNLASDIKNSFSDIGKGAGKAFKEGYKDVFLSAKDIVEEENKNADAIDKTNKKLKERKDIGYESTLSEGSVMIKKNIEYWKELIEVAERAQDSISDPVAWNKLQNQIKDFKQAIEDIKGNGDVFDGIELDLSGSMETDMIFKGMDSLSGVLGQNMEDLVMEFSSAYEWDYNEFVKWSQKKIEQADEENKLKKEKLAEWMQFSGDAIYEIGSLAMAFSEQKIKKYEEEIAANNEMYDVILNNEETTEQQRKEAEEEKAEREEKIQKKIAKEKEKQAKIDKATAAFQIGLNTAAAILRTFAQLGFPAGVPASLAVGAIGALQLATVLAKPIPKYKHGRKGGQAELAEVGEGGQSEVVTDSKGKFKYITPNKSTYTYLEKGDNVISSVPEYLEGLTLDKLNQAAIMTSLKSQSQALNNKQTQENLSKNIEDAIYKGYSKVKVPVQAAPDYDRLARGIAKEMQFTRKRDV